MWHSDCAIDTDMGELVKSTVLYESVGSLLLINTEAIPRLWRWCW